MTQPFFKNTASHFAYTIELQSYHARYYERARNIAIPNAIAATKLHANEIDPAERVFFSCHHMAIPLTPQKTITNAMRSTMIAQNHLALILSGYVWAKCSRNRSRRHENSVAVGWSTGLVWTASTKGA